MPMGSQQPQELNLMTGEPASKIALINGNSTMFKGTADLTTNENVNWKMFRYMSRSSMET